MKKLCLIFAISLFPVLGFSQYAGDSVIIYIDNRVEVNVAVPDYSELKTSDKVVLALKGFQNLIPDLADQVSPDTPDLVKFSVGISITTEPGDNTYTYLIKNEELSNTGYRDRAIISGDEFTIFITTADISKIPDLSVPENVEKVIETLSGKTRMSKSLYYECVDGNVRELEDKSQTIGRTDFLEFSPGAGGGLVKSTWVADLSFKIGLGFSKKGALKYNPYVSTNVMFEFDDEYNISLNTFLNLGFGWNLDKNAEKPELLALELGYLVGNKGELFGENTFRFGLNWSPLDAVTVSPHLYITDNFETVFPGIRVGFGF